MPTVTKATENPNAWMNPAGAIDAVVVRSLEFARSNRAEIEKSFGGFRVLVPGDVTLQTFGRIVMFKWRPARAKEFAWVDAHVLPRLRKDRKLEWVAA